MKYAITIEIITYVYILNLKTTNLKKKHLLLLK